MNNILKIVRTGCFFLLLLLISLIGGTGCASDRKAREIIRRTDSSCDLAHLGRNKYYYSPKYKRLLSSNYREIKKRK